MAKENEFVMPEIPKTSGSYAKLEVGENRFRILDSPIAGMVYWKTKDDGKKTPIRVRPNQAISMGDLEDVGERDRPKYFQAFPIWNGEEVQVLELTQKTILRALEALLKNSKWGDLREYDFVIKKEGEGKETEYQVMPEPKEELSEEAQKAWAETLEKGFDLEKLYDGESPFGITQIDKDSDKEEEEEEEEEEIDLSDIPF